MRDEIIKTYIEDGRLIFCLENGKEFTLGYDYTGLNNSPQECELIELIDEKVTHDKQRPPH